MREISSKTDYVGDTLPASDFNANFRTELQSIVTDTGQTLDPEGGPDTDLDMIGKAIAMYSNASQYYVDTGSADAYEVDRTGNLQPLASYIDGLTVCFKAVNTNTGASTLDVDGIGAKDLVDNAGSALVAGMIVAARYVTARYNSTSDDFEIISDLNRWFNSGDDFLPVVSGSGTLGDATHLIEGAYFGDSCHLYLSDGQDLDIYHNGSNAFIDNSTGWLIFNSSEIHFQTGSVYRWNIDSSGHFIPDSTYNIGSTSDLCGNVYLGDSKYIYFGDDQDASIGVPGDLHISTSGATAITLRTNSSNRWVINSDGDLTPYGTNVYDIGATSARVKAFYGVDADFSGNVYLGDNDVIYLGNSNDCLIKYNATVAPDDLQLKGPEISFYTNSFKRWYIAESDGDLHPETGSALDIGSSGVRVDNIYCVTLDESSDIMLKQNITPTFLGLEFINKLNPIAYNFEDRTKTRHGLAAQQVLEAIEELGYKIEDFGAISNEDGNWGLNYSQFIAPIISAIQELSRKIGD